MSIFNSSKTDRFIQLCLRSAFDQQALQAAQALGDGPELDWEAVLDKAGAEKIAPLLYTLLEDQTWLPEVVEQRLKLEYQHNHSRNIILLAELNILLSQIKSIAAPVILLKGAALVQQVYPDAGMRPLSDLDLLVKPEDVHCILPVLNALGYSQIGSEASTGATLFYENELTLVKDKPFPIFLEIHWSLLNSPYYQHSLPLSWFWQTAQPPGDGTALGLSDEAQLVYLSAHLFLHHQGKELLWLQDIAMLLKQRGAAMDWEAACNLAQACRLVLPLQQTLAILAEDWGISLPDGVMERLQALTVSREESQVFSRFSQRKRSVARRFLDDLIFLPNWSTRLRFAWHNLFPSAAYMRRRYQIQSSWLVPLYYPYRWLLGIRSVL